MLLDPVHRHRLGHTIFIALPQTRSTRHVDAPHALTHTSMCRNRGTRAVSGQFMHVCTRSGRSQGGGHACAGLGQPARSYVRVLRTLAAYGASYSRGWFQPSMILGDDT